MKSVNDGELELDGEKQDNKVNVLGAGIEAGCQILSFLSCNAGYGGIQAGDNNTQSSMFRLSIVFIYVNMDKAKNKSK